jgi:hypothetical protein
MICWARACGEKKLLSARISRRPVSGEAVVEQNQISEMKTSPMVQ